MITTADYLTFPPQERWAIIEERVFGCRMTIDTDQDPRFWAKPSPRDFDQPNGWWEIVEEMQRKGWRYGLNDWPDGSHRSVFTKGLGSVYCFEDASSVAIAVQVAALRAVRFIKE